MTLLPSDLQPATVPLEDLLADDHQRAVDRAAARRRLDRLPPPVDGGRRTLLPEIGGASVLDDISALRPDPDPRAA